MVLLELKLGGSWGLAWTSAEAAPVSVLVQQKVLDGLRQRQGGHAAQTALAHRSADPDTAQMRQPPRTSCQEGKKKREETAAAAHESITGLNGWLQPSSECREK